MKKAEILAHWQGLEEKPASTIHPCAVMYRHEGSTFDEDGIRITGSQKFIDSILSVLKPLLRFENGGTRLQVVYKESVDRESGRPLGSFNCYIQVHERGDEAKRINAMVEDVKERRKAKERELELAGLG
jgi:hypothetical protein